LAVTWPPSINSGFKKTHHRRLTFTALLCEVRRFHQTAETRGRTVRPPCGSGRFLPRTSGFQLIESRDRLHAHSAIPQFIGSLDLARFRRQGISRNPIEENPARSGSRAHHRHAHQSCTRTFHRAHLCHAHLFSTRTVCRAQLLPCELSSETQGGLHVIPSSEESGYGRRPTSGSVDSVA
jgi:hypothetical protein